MNKQQLLSNKTAEEIAEQYIVCSCKNHVEKHMADLAAIKKDEREKAKNDPLFAPLFRRLDKHEKEFMKMITEVWEWERKTIIANLKKIKKSWVTKGKEEDTAESVLYPKSEAKKRLQKGAKPIDLATLEEQGKVAIKELGVDEVFSVNTPEIKKWIKEYLPIFSEELEKVNVEKLKKELIEGLEAGEGIPQLTKRVNTTYDNWNKFRSEMIARSEILRASNMGNLNAYRQSGVVVKHEWLTFFDDRTCPWCENMDGTTVSIEGKFFDIGDSFTVRNPDTGKDVTMDFNYQVIEGPPLHPLCRCTTIPVVAKAVLNELYKKGLMSIYMYTLLMKVSERNGGE
jgi:SPP1 gp7 family putative phage head morphogenesis protein